MTKHFGSIASAASLVALLLCSQNAHAACTKDTDCKGDRICQGGRCTSPPPATQAAAPVAGAAPIVYLPPVQLPDQTPTVTYTQQGAPPAPEPAPAMIQANGVAQAQNPQPSSAEGVSATYTPAPREASTPTAEAPLTWHKGYAELSTPMSFKGWLGLHNGDGLVTSGFGAGVRVAGYYAGSHVHVGGFLAYSTMDYTFEGYSSASASNLAAGVALKFGGSVGRRIWMGFALDAGFNALLKGDAFTNNFVGVHLYTGYCLDALLVGNGPFKMAMTGRLGTDIEPFMGNPGIDHEMWQVRTGLTLGVTFGGGSQS